VFGRSSEIFLRKLARPRDDLAVEGFLERD
jgi:hypothetical protein